MILISYFFFSYCKQPFTLPVHETNTGYKMIVLIGGEKGGTGKTTIATNLAQMRATQGNDVLLIDTDKQESSTFWASTRDDEEITPRIPTVQKYGKAITKDILDLAKRYQDIIIDAGGRDSYELRASMVAADVIYIPVQASQFDIWTLEGMAELVEQSQALNPKLQAFVVINRASANPAVSESQEAEELLQDFENLNFSGAILRDRIAYRKAAAVGQGVSELKPSDPKAIAEITHLYQIIFSS